MREVLSLGSGQGRGGDLRHELQRKEGDGLPCGYHIISYVYIYIYIYIYMYIYIYREREREIERDVCIYIYIYIYICAHMLPQKTLKTWAREE